MKKIYLLFSFLLAFSDAKAASVEHDFTAILGVFNASDTKFTYELTPKDYAIRSEVKTAGVFLIRCTHSKLFIRLPEKSNKTNLKPPAINTNLNRVLPNVPKNWFIMIKASQYIV